eukprot:jgi/Chlat1/7758/Chrsp66S07225
MLCTQHKRKATATDNVSEGLGAQQQLGAVVVRCLSSGIMAAVEGGGGGGVVAADVPASDGTAYFDEMALKWDAWPEVRALWGEADVLEVGCGTGVLAMHLAEKARSVTAVDSSKGMIGVSVKVSRFEKQTALVQFRLVASALVSNQGHIVTKMLEHKVQKAGTPNVHPVCMQLESPSDLSSQRFDLAFSSMATHHIDDVQAFITLLAQFLKPGGTLVTFDLQKTDISIKMHTKQQHETAGVYHHEGFSCEEFQEFYAKAGLTSVECSTALHFHHWVEEDEVAMDFPILACVGKAP